MTAGASLAERVAALGEVERAAVLAGLSDAELASWAFWGRENQQEPEGAWWLWLILAGRGFGKTRTGAETVRAWVESGRYGRIALVAPTAADGRDVMVEGESGLLAVCASMPGGRPTYEPSKRRITWPSGALATLYSGEEPERLRGPQHDAGWLDEVCAWKRMVDTWDMYSMGLRLGTHPRTVVTTTPKPVALLRGWLKEERPPSGPAGHLPPEGGGGGVVVTRGSTYDNAANLAGPFLAQILDRYEGTALGRQELHAAVLDESPGALWRRAWFERPGFRVKVVEASGAAANVEGVVFDRIGVGVDPSVSETGGGDACGIVVVGSRKVAGVSRGTVLDDFTVHGSPAEWAREVEVARARWGASVVVAETNQGGALVTGLLRAVGAGGRVVGVSASLGKAGRAEPVSALYEQGRMEHRAGAKLGALEDELVTWVPGAKGAAGRSPNRLDALVHVSRELLGSGAGTRVTMF